MCCRHPRELAISDIVRVHVGTSGSQWCYVVPTEWHYMTIITRERPYNFGFESAAMLLLWVNTLERIVFPEWTRLCMDDMTELFKGAISTAQHRYHLSSCAGTASPSDLFHPSLPELCPSLYPLAPMLCQMCTELGVSFASNADPVQKYLLFAAVAVLEAPVPREEALLRIRTLISRAMSSSDETPFSSRPTFLVEAKKTIPNIVAELELLL